MPRILFTKGKSGNPKGRPKGPSKNTLIKDKLIEALERDAIDVVKAIVAAAKGGDMVAARIIMDRLVPTQKAIMDTEGSRRPEINILIQPAEAVKPMPVQVVNATPKLINKEDK